MKDGDGIHIGIVLCLPWKSVKICKHNHTNVYPYDFYRWKRMHALLKWRKFLIQVLEWYREGGLLIAMLTSFFIFLHLSHELYSSWNFYFFFEKQKIILFVVQISSHLTSSPSSSSIIHIDVGRAGNIHTSIWIVAVMVPDFMEGNRWNIRTTK